MSIWNQIKGWLAVVTAFIACPCHLPVTLPIVLSLTAGTAVGAWLSTNRDLFVAFLVVYFFVGLGAGFYWLTKAGKPADKSARVRARAAHSRPRPAAARHR